MMRIPVTKLVGKMASIKIVRISELMAYEFPQVETDLSRITPDKLPEIARKGMSYQKAIEDIKQGHFALLVDSPISPALTLEGSTSSKQWSITPNASHNLSQQAAYALSSRARMANNPSSGAGYKQTTAGYDPVIEQTYVPEPIVRDLSDKTPELKYEYCIDIACSLDTFRERIGYSFSLAKTKEEVSLGNWTHEITSDGVRLKVLSAVDEPKKLLVKVADTHMGLTPLNKVNLNPIGTNKVTESFIPVIPSIELGARLGLPTEGYLYHFHNEALIQEFKLLGDNKWAFYATRTRDSLPDDSKGANKLQSAILVYNMLNGAVATNQHIVHRSKQLTGEELAAIDSNWLDDNGVSINPTKLIEATKKPSADRSSDVREEPKPINEKPNTHTVKVVDDKRESWVNIAEQYNLTPKRLLELNPTYNTDPMSLKIGDALIVQEPTITREEPIKFSEYPPVGPEDINHPLNVFYKFTESLLPSSSHRAINHESIVNDELPVVRVATDNTTGFEMGFSQVTKTQTREEVFSALFTDETPDVAKEAIRKFNAHLNEPVRQGEIVIIVSGEPTKNEDKNKFSYLIEDAQAASEALIKLTEEELATANRYFELLDHKVSQAGDYLVDEVFPSTSQYLVDNAKLTDNYAIASLGVGVAAASIESRLTHINEILDELNNLYVKEVAVAHKTGGINSGPFFAERAHLLNKLDDGLSSLSSRKVKIPAFRQIKRNLKLSSRSVIHNADEIIAKGVVPHLGRRIARVSIAIAGSKAAGWLGVAIGGLSAANNIHDACIVQENGECAKTSVKEIAGLYGGYVGGIKGGAAGVTIALAVVGAAASAPVVAIAVIIGGGIGAGIGSVSFSTAAKVAAEGVYEFGEFIYETAVELVEEF
ncbi:LysM domain-containing protein [Vibrio chagasii]|nr:LysM domain-containing protein [Vibrio chagasii]